MRICFMRLVKDRRGNFGILTALAIVPLLGAAGIAIDYGHALEVRTQLMGAADAAALGAISAKSPALAAAQQMTQDGEISVGETDGRDLFLSQRDLNLGATAVDVDVNVVKSGGDISSNVSFTAHVPTTFMQIFGQETMTVTGVATAVYGAQAKFYTDFYMLLDNTPSMGIGATKADMNALKAATNNSQRQAGDGNCAFACHIGYTDAQGNFHEPDPNNMNQASTYQIARANKITLRIDVVAEAAQALIEDVKDNMATAADQYQIAAYTFGKAALEPGYRIQEVSSLTPNMATLATEVGKVGLMTTDHHGFNADALTSFDTALSAVNNKITAKGGDGSSAATARKVLFFVTDGVGDSLKSSCASNGYYGWAGASNRCFEPIDPQECKVLKDRSIDIAILYTTYLPLTGDSIWDTAIQPHFAKDIAPKLQACASEGLFLEVKPEDDMEAAIKILFTKAASSEKKLRLTQ